MARLLQQRLFDLDSVLNLEEMRLLPGRCHILKHNFKNHLALDLVHPDRLVFKPNHDPLPETSGVLNWAGVTKIEIVGIGDYH